MTVFCFYLLAITISTVELFSTSFALYNGINGFQMRWISNNRETNVLVRYTVQTFNVRTQMVLDITRTLPKKYTINI